MKTVTIRKSSSPDTCLNVRYCDTFFNKFWGLMFSKELEEDAGILLVEKNQTRINTSIHMLFMNYDLAVLWLDQSLIVVDKVLAKKWGLIYLSKEPAQFVLELHPSKISEFSIGDQLRMEMKP